MATAKKKKDEASEKMRWTKPRKWKLRMCFFLSGHLGIFRYMVWSHFLRQPLTRLIYSDLVSLCSDKFIHNAIFFKRSRFCDDSSFFHWSGIRSCTTSKQMFICTLYTIRKHLNPDVYIVFSCTVQPISLTANFRSKNWSLVPIGLLILDTHQPCYAKYLRNTTTKIWTISHVSREKTLLQSSCVDRCLRESNNVSKTISRATFALSLKRAM